MRLYQHNWPGNVRELRNYVQRAYIMADDIIECDVAVSEQPAKTDDGTTITIRVGTPLEEVERRVTMATLVYCGHVKRKAAEILGVSLKTLYNRLEGYNGKEEAAEESHMPATRVAVVDDHQLVRMGLKQIIEAQSDFTWAGEAKTGREALALLRRRRAMCCCSICRCRTCPGWTCCARSNRTTKPSPRWCSAPIRRNSTA